jgi:hypothetical protein
MLLGLQAGLVYVEDKERWAVFVETVDAAKPGDGRQ